MKHSPEADLSPVRLPRVPKPQLPGGSVDRYPELAAPRQALDQLRIDHLELAAQSLMAAEGNLYLPDLIVTAMIQRSYGVVDALIDAVDTYNIHVAAPLLRLQLDTLFRAHYIASGADVDDITMRLLRGEEFRKIKDADGKPLNDSRPIVEQGVRAGALLTLEVRSTEAEARYDDLVEAVATEVEARQAAWSQQDSVSMSVASTCLLFLVVGLLLLRQGPGGLVTPLCALACSCLLVLAAFALWRLRGAGTWPLVMTAGALGAVAAHTAFIGPPTGLRMMAAGGALAAIVLVCLPFLEEDRWLISGPLLVASCLGLTGMGVDLLNRPLASVLAVIAAVVAIISLLAPWLALASVPIDISLPDRTDRPVLEPGTEVTPTLTARVLNAHGLVLSARVACAVIVLACVPTLASVGYAGAGLVADRELGGAPGGSLRGRGGRGGVLAEREHGAGREGRRVCRGVSAGDLQGRVASGAIGVDSAGRTPARVGVHGGAAR